jgi:hypothetical protein
MCHLTKAFRNVRFANQMTQGSDGQRAHVLCCQTYTREEERAHVCVRSTVCVCVCGKLVVVNPVPLFDRNNIVAFFVGNIRPIASWSLCF